MKKIMIPFLFLVAIGLTPIASATTTIYKWTDEQGNTHFGSQPGGPGTQEIKINPPASNQEPSAAQQRTQKLQEDQKIKQQQQDDQLAKEKEVSDAQKYQQDLVKLCGEYEKNLNTLQETGRRVYTVDGSGQYHYFSDEDRQKEIANVKQKMDLYCVKNKIESSRPDSNTKMPGPNTTAPSSS